MTFLCINLHDFHSNQNGAETTTQIKFLAAKNQEKAEETIHRMYPEIAWFVVPKSYCDKRIVTCHVSNK